MMLQLGKFFASVRSSRDVYTSLASDFWPECMYEKSSGIPLRDDY